MSSVAVALPHRPRLGRGSLILLVVVASAVTIGVFVWLHKDVPLPYATFRGACERLRASGLPITERDWFCHPIPWTARAGFVMASLLAAAAFALPSAILVASGRRLAALAPLLVLPLVTHPALLYGYGLRWWEGTWPDGQIANVLVTLLLILVPAALVVVVRRPPVGPRVRISLIAGAAAAVACVLAVIPIRYLTDVMFGRHFATIGGTYDSRSLLWPAVAMALFAAILGADRRWWPWALAPVALLLSFAPAAALLVGPEGILDWSLFGAVVPLFLVGLICSVWRPLASAITDRLGRHVSSAPEESVMVAPTSMASDLVRPRPATVLNTLAAAVLCLSLVVFVADPLPAQLGTALPTYLGQRALVDDVRVRMNLGMAMDAMDRYRAEAGGYRGFDAEAATVIEPRLAWTDRPGGAATPLWMWVVTARRDEARVAGLSMSGNAFCLQRTPEGLTTGMASGGLGAVTAIRALQLAVSACGERSWTSSAIQVPQVETMCNGLDRSGGYLICRMVQVLSVDILRQTKPEGVVG